MGDVIGFRREFEERAQAEIEGVEKIEWFGSIANDFTQGRSDLDLIIWGDVSAGDKEKVSEIVKELNFKHNLGLEKAPYQHPTPFFVDNPGKAVLYDLLLNKGGLSAIGGFRSIWKHHAPTYGQVWGLEERAEQILPEDLVRIAKRIYHELL